MNKTQLAHIGAEIVVIGGITYFLINENTKLQDRVKKLEETIIRLSEHVDSLEQRVTLSFKNVGSYIEKLQYEEDYNPPPPAQKQYVHQPQQMQQQRIPTQVIKPPQFSAANSGVPQPTNYTSSPQEHEKLDKKGMEETMRIAREMQEQAGISSD